MSKVRTAIVIGSGIAGPVTAAALVKAGIEATVHEAYPAESDGIGGALAIAPNGQAALGIIGAEESLRASAIPMRRMVMSMGGAEPFETPSLPDMPPLQMVNRSDLHRLLRERALAAGVEFAYGKRLVAADDGPDGVTARFADGTSAHADVLIGADGVRSTVRRLIDPDAPGPDYTGMLGFEGLADLDLDVDPGTMTFAYGRRAYYLYWRQPGGGATWGVNLPWKTYMTLNEARTIPTDKWLRTLRETYADDHPGSDLAERTTPENLQITGALHIMPPVPHWHRGRMVLVGDAVHAPSNSTGQGASLAIESAIELARCLRDLPDPSSAFAAYERLRRHRVEKITARGAKINHAKTPPGPVTRKAISLLMPLALKAMNVEKTMGWEQRHTIDWDAPVTPTSTTSAA
ncbi:FAD-dependent oxidoreductase [Actinoallomurus iriomotensis]|uniref:FAD-dependent oxidoreductase n=1 Tax=Actinoallomurus iriomotensis TaxID=478107 RepID=A0A9W6W5D7_9ACTN|nr:NAD(P)/FAD-dependent oxidoreductase [Actinoallomurus iriomotensis]GLY89946.1 FAD-dependent oxidoreductase [Actinoallomurus iriomotensis]